MTAAWPSGLPAWALVGSFAEQPEINVARQDLPGAPPPMRRRTSIDSHAVSFATFMDNDEYETFLDFYADTLSDGVLPFSFTDPRSQATVTYSFKGGPRCRAVGPDLFEVTFDLRRMP